MDFAQLILQRQSGRKYDPTRPVEAEKLQAVLTAGALAPSARNAQPWHFTVATGDKARRVGEVAQWRGSNAFSLACPVFIVLSETPPDPNEARLRAKGVNVPEFRQVDMGICVAHMVLQAADLGLTTCMLGLIDTEALAAELHIDTPIRLVLCMGYAAAEDPLRPKTRRPLEETVTYL